MKKLIALFLLPFLIACNAEKIVEPVDSDVFSGQYQSVPYNSSSEEPVVILLYTQEGNKVYGTGSWNAITFNFEGTSINKHTIFTFQLNDTNMGDLNGDIDAWLGEDLSMAGGYKLWNSSTLLNGPIRFKLVKNMSKKHDQGMGSY
ncbi:hypothetical protein [Melioribacter sp. OK-6-Me]|uniref:hypothetical protein n=1 Tax=unclassified Melioribacter TaxID=2627329 RepID=UPI003ED926FD